MGDDRMTLDWTVFLCWPIGFTISSLLFAVSGDLLVSRMRATTSASRASLIVYMVMYAIWLTDMYLSTRKYNFQPELCLYISTDILKYRCKVFCSYNIFYGLNSVTSMNGSTKTQPTASDADAWSGISMNGWSSSTPRIYQHWTRWNFHDCSLLNAPFPYTNRYLDTWPVW